MDVVLGPIRALVNIDPGTEVIHLSSQVVVEEITKVRLNKWVQLSPELSSQNIKGKLTICCVQYLSSCDLLAASLKAESDMEGLLRQSPFLAHAATAWDMYFRDFWKPTSPSPLASPSQSSSLMFDKTPLSGTEGEKASLYSTVINEENDEMIRLIIDLTSSHDRLMALLLLSVYLGKDPSTAMLTWEEASSWVATMPELHVLAELKLVSLFTKLNSEDTQLSVKSVDERGATALHIAARIGIEDDVSVLLKAGAEPHALDDSLKTPIDYAVNSGHDAITARLFEEYCETFGYTDSSGIDIRMIAELYARYINAGRGTDTPQLYSALVHAIKQGMTGMVRCLLDLGVDPNDWDETGIPALHHAINLTGVQHLRHKSEEIIDLLLRREANPSAISKNESAESGFHVAARLGSMDAILLLLRFSANTRSLDANGQSVLFATAEADIEEQQVEWIMRYLVLGGADVEQADKNGSRILHIAAQRGLKFVILNLVRRFAAVVDPKDKEGKTPLDYAHDSGQTETVAMLQELMR
ncbi:hypothetical protein GQX73_g9199 [Xylaria multiplex]|uniref:Uncharacterized protein n=1 Tax=Xylaria multiplex TaxID=323545 RepID=A0A7C8IMT3_9PEZI|nr:hypothetical protein GQX73_g9199 [Xylaria multiplex]